MTSKQDTAAAAPGAITPGAMMLVAEFCAKYRISRSKYQDMKRRHETPQEMRVGQRLLITPEAEARWLADMVERTRALEADRFAVPTPQPAPAPTEPPARSFASGKKIGRPRKESAGR